MLKHSRKLLLLAALCWVGPASAEYATVNEDECPFSHGARAIVVSGSASVGEVPISVAERAYYP